MLDDRNRADLERRGVESVRALLAANAGIGQGAAVNLENGRPFPEHPNRAEVEGWLREKEGEAAAIAEQRHKEQLTIGRDGVAWARHAAIVAWLAVAVSVAVAAAPYLFGG